MGAGAVTALSCGDSGCPLGHDDRVATTVDFCRELLGSIGSSPERVATELIPDLPEAIPRSEVTDRFGPHGAVDVMLALVAGHDQARAIVIDHRGAPTGVVEIETDACTACTMCARICPTGALASTDTDDRVTISFDPAMCTACAQCLHTCPELARGAISMRPRVDVAALAAGRTTLIAAETLVCENCGGPIAPAPMMARINGMLGAGHDPVRAMITRRCIDCRGVAG